MTENQHDTHADYIAGLRTQPAPLPTNGGECPGCRRVMSVREGVEQGVCNDCLGGAL